MSAKRLTLLALLALAAAVTAPCTQAQNHIRSAAASVITASSGSSANDSDAITTASLANADTATNATTNATVVTVSPVVSVWAPGDACSATTQRAGCIFEPTCSLCLTRPGCAIEAMTGRCVSVSRITRASVDAGAQYLESGKAEYCAASDAACATCRSGDSDAPCLGAGGCVCMRQCELQSTAPLECLSALSLTPTAYLVMAGMVFCTASIAYQVRRARRAQALGSGRLVQRRRQRPATNEAPQPLALKLDNWKKDRSDHSEAFGAIELRSCYVQMGDDNDDGRADSHGDSDSQRETVLGNGSFCSDLNGFDDVAAPRQQPRQS